MNPVAQILRLYQAQPKPRKLALIGCVVLIAAMTGYLVIWLVSPAYGVLFSQLDSRDAGQIITQLEQANIAYTVRNQGADILIDKNLIDKTRIKLMSNDLHFTQNVGFELFDKTDFGMTDFSQKINYQRALQGELERTINSLDEVRQARVQLSIPESHLFQQDNLPRVAVTLHLKQALSPQQIKSIQQLITASIANLPANNVVIVDQNGNGLIANEEDSSSGHFAAKKNIEHYLSEKVTQMLHQIFSDEQVMVKIDATLNYDELQRERIKPQHHGAIVHEKKTRHISPDKTGKKKSGQEDLMHEKTWEFGKEKEQFTRANGTIERLTISVVLPKKTGPSKIMQVERLVKSVVGFNAMRGDTISVEALIAKPTLPMIQESIPAPSSHMTFPILNGFAGLFVLSLVTLLLCLHARRKQRQRLLTELRQWLIEHE
jgi:flagellar M-ring protein FliF